MIELVKEAAMAGISLHLADGKLQYKQHGADFPGELKNKISQHKESIIDYLLENEKTKSQRKVTNLPDVLRETAKLSPNSTALVCGNQTITFEQLVTKIDRLAHHIKNSSQGQPVGFILDRSINTMVAIFAALRANVPYVPIEPSNPIERIKFILEDSKVKLVLSEQAHLKLIDALPEEKFDIHSLLTADNQHNELDTTLDDIPLDSPAYIIYTSGSTGAPKGVICSHSNLLHFSKVMEQQFQVLNLHAASKWLWTASYAFDASIKAVVSLAQGKRVVIPDENEIADPKALAQLIKREKIEVVNTPPILMEYLLPQLKAFDIKTHIIVSGDDINEALWKSLAEYREAQCIKVLNAYGPTETTVNAFFGELIPGEEITFGKPVLNTKYFILNEQKQLVPEGEEGELYISGEGLSLGYLNRELENRNQFVYLNEQRCRAFKTGDIVVQCANGNVKFLKRIDDQIKSRGYRIELGEIRSAILRHESVKEVAVLAKKDNGDSKVVAFVVFNGESQDTEKLSDFLVQVLPGYMLPSQIEGLPELPLTNGGKIDANSLLTTKHKAVNQTEQTSLQSRLTRIWLDTLSIEKVELDDNFFKLGGHSLLAMKLLQLIEQEFGLAMDIRELFTRLTLKSQLEWLEENTKEFADLTNCPVETGLKNIWKECLGEEPEEDTDNFFKMGGHSLLAMKLLSKVKEDFGVDMEIRQLFGLMEFGQQVSWLKEQTMSNHIIEKSIDSDELLELEI